MHTVGDAAVADTAGRQSGATETDAVIVGAGPVGLFQVFELGLQEMRAHVVDSLPQPGGQCIELYADKPLYDIPALPLCTGRQLIDRLLEQIRPFAPTWHLDQEVTAVVPQADGRFRLETSRGTQLLAKTVFVAGGVGSFQPRLLKIEGLDRFRETQLFYRVRDPALFAGRRVVVVGGGEAALEWALNFAAAGPHAATSVTLVHRRDSYTGSPAQVARLRELGAAGRVQMVTGQVTGIEAAGARLTALQLAGADGAPQTLPLDMLLVLQGLSPRLGPIASWGLGLDHKLVVVDTEKFQTSVPGIFAVGDIATYPGKRKLILSGFHEAALAAFGAAAHVLPGQRIPLEYTTSSSRLHRLLGVAPPALD